MISQSSRTETRLRPGPISIRRNCAFRPASGCGLDELESRLVPSVTLSVTSAPYNADPTGVVDATAAIQFCINDVTAAGGGTVFIPNGTYKVSFPANAGTSPAIKLRSNITIQGNGQNNSVIRLANQQGNYDAIFGAETYSTHLSQVKIDNMGIDGNSPNNPVINATNLTAQARYAVRIYAGDNIVIQRCHFFNMLSVNTITFNGTDASNVTIANNTFDHIGGGTVDFDHSTIYTNCNNATISGNTFASTNGPGTNGARTAIETHGNNQTVTKNDISGYFRGINVTGSTALGSNTQLYQYNTITNAADGFAIWAESMSPDPVLQYCTIRDNTVTLDIAGWTGFFDTGGRQGITMVAEATNQGKIDHLDIINNTITFTNYASTSGPRDFFCCGIFFNSYTGSPNFTNIRILNNHINHSLGAGIFIDWDMNNLEISGNVITNPGSSPVYHFGNDNQSAIRIANNMQNLRIEGNSFIDDRTTASMVYGIWEATNNLGNSTYFNNQVQVTSGAIVSQLYSSPKATGGWKYTPH